MAPTVSPRLAVHPFGPSNIALCGAVVVMVSVVDPLPVTEAGLKLHALSLGRPEHDVVVKLMVPVYPGWPVIVNMVVPLPPTGYRDSWRARGEGETAGRPP